MSNLCLCWRRAGPKRKLLQIRVFTLYADADGVPRWVRVQMTPPPPVYRSEDAPEKAIAYAIKIGARLSMGNLITGSRYWEELGPMELLALPKLIDVPNRVKEKECREP